MLKEYLYIGKDNNAEEILDRFRMRCHNNPIQLDEVLSTVETIVRDFSARGHQLAAINSVFQAKRVLQGKDYFIEIEASFGRKPSLVERVLDFFRK